MSIPSCSDEQLSCKYLKFSGRSNQRKSKVILGGKADKTNRGGGIQLAVLAEKQKDYFSQEMFHTIFFSKSPY